MHCISPPPSFINDTTSPACTRTTRTGWKNLPSFDAFLPNDTGHNRTGEDNADAHMKAPGYGPRGSWSRSPRAKLDFGPGNRIFYGEFRRAAGTSGCWSR